MPRLRSKPAVLPPALIGWRERVRLPALGIGPIVAKVDTGARTAALHAEDIEIEIRGLRRLVRFTVPIDGRNHHCEAALAGHRQVKNTSGKSQNRAVIETEIGIGPERIMAEVTLTDRTDMGVPMLLGRATVRGRFIVHPGKSFILSRPKRPRKKRP